MADEIVSQAKVCTKCGVSFPATADFFNRHKLGAFGLNPVCKACRKVTEAARRAAPGYKQAYQNWKRDNPVLVKAATARFAASGKKAASDRAYREKNRDALNAAADARRRADMETARSQRRKWREANREKARLSARAYQKRMFLEGGGQAVSARMSCLVRATMRRVLAGGAGGRSWRSLVGYGPDDLIRHLERQFAPGMTWKNMGRWHIDHIQPVASFRITGTDCPEFKACWSLPNLRPLWAADNLSKSARRTHLL
jgi:hypothetical protein